MPPTPPIAGEGSWSAPGRLPCNNFLKNWVPVPKTLTPPRLSLTLRLAVWVCRMHKAKSAIYCAELGVFPFLALPPQIGHPGLGKIIPPKLVVFVKNGVNCAMPVPDCPLPQLAIRGSKVAQGVANLGGGRINHASTGVRCGALECLTVTHPGWLNTLPT